MIRLANTLYGVAAVIGIAGVATDTTWLIVASAAVVGLGIAVVVPASIRDIPKARHALREQRQLWRDSPPIDVDESQLMSAPRAIVRRIPLVVGVMLVGLELIIVGIVVQGMVEESASVALRIVFSAFVLATLIWVVGVFRSVLIATDEVLLVRNSVFRTWIVHWADVEEIEPTHSGLAFALRDGRRMVAFTTAKNGVTFMKPRYDKALLAELRSRLS